MDWTASELLSTAAQHEKHQVWSVHKCRQCSVTKFSTDNSCQQLFHPACVLVNDYGVQEAGSRQPKFQGTCMVIKQ